MVVGFAFSINHHSTSGMCGMRLTNLCYTNFPQDEYSRLSRNASLGVHGYVLVFSIASRQSFEMIKQVNDLLLSTLGDAPDVPRVLVGSMKDLANQRQVNQAVSCCRCWKLSDADLSIRTKN